MSDIRGDWHLLEVLRKTTLADVPDAHWEIICKQVVDANGIRNLSGQARQIVFDGVEKAKSFGGNRSEAGRYAASVRWQNQNGGGKGSKGGSGKGPKVHPPLTADELKEISTTRMPISDIDFSAEESAAATGPDRRTARAIADPSLSSLASAIRADLRAQGKKVPFGAAPYLDALESLDSIKDKFYEDSAASVVAYLLSNLTTYKGPNAKAIKAELKRRLKEGDPSPKSETSEEGFIGEEEYDKKTGKWKERTPEEEAKIKAFWEEQSKKNRERIARMTPEERKKWDDELNPEDWSGWMGGSKSETSADRKGGRLFPVMPAPTKGATEAARRGQTGFKPIGRGKAGRSKTIGRAPNKPASPSDYKPL